MCCPSNAIPSETPAVDSDTPRTRRQCYQFPAIITLISFLFAFLIEALNHGENRCSLEQISGQDTPLAGRRNNHESSSNHAAGKDSVQNTSLEAFSASLGLDDNSALSDVGNRLPKRD
jgi:hypothetical protein